MAKPTDTTNNCGFLSNQLNGVINMIKPNSTQKENAVQAVTVLNADNLKMSSIEISQLTGKQHSHVIRDIKKMLLSLDLVNPNMDAIDYKGFSFEKRKDNGQISVINLDQELTITLISGYNIKLRHAIVKRWMELEKQAATVKATRLDGKEVRKLETDAIKDLIEYAEASGSKNANMYYANITKMTNSILGIESGQRDNLTAKQLDQVRIAETMVKMAISDGLEQSLPYKEIYKLCKDRVSSIASVLLN